MSKLGSTKVKLNGIHSVALRQHIYINERTASKLQITIIPGKRKEITDSKRLNFPLKYTTGCIHTVCITKELHSLVEGSMRRVMPHPHHILPTCLVTGMKEYQLAINKISKSRSIVKAHWPFLLCNRRLDKLNGGFRAKIINVGTLRSHHN